MKKAKLTAGEKATTASKSSGRQSGGSEDVALPRKSARKSQLPPSQVPQVEKGSKVGVASKRERKSLPAGEVSVKTVDSMAEYLTTEKIRMAFQPVGEEISDADRSREIRRLVMCLSKLIACPEIQFSNSEFTNVLKNLHSQVDSIDDENWNIFQHAIMLALLPRNCGSCFTTLEKLIDEVLVHQPGYAISIAQLLVAKFVRPNSRPGPCPISLTDEESPSIAELKCFDVSVKLLCRIVEAIGMKRLNRPLTNILSSNYPYVLKPALTHFYYIKNLLTMNKIAGKSVTYAVLSVLFHKLTHLDAQIPRQFLDTDKLQEMVIPKTEKTASSILNSFIIPEGEADDLVIEILKSYGKISDEVEHVHQIATLDIALSYLISFISRVHEKINFNSLLAIFENDILTTFNTNCVQFAFFYLINQKEEYLNAFLDFLWKKFVNVNTPAVVRILCIGYISGVLARSTKVEIRTLKRWISRLSAFAQEYLNCKSSSTSSHWSNVNVLAHGPFYAVCQGIFYAFAFRHFELVYGNMPLFKEEAERSKKVKENKEKPNLSTLPPPSSSSFIYSLNLQRLITCDLNPLKACSPDVANTFVEAAHAYQISYCKTVLERNNRANIRNMVLDSMREVSNSDSDGLNILNESFFPFDPLPLVYAKTIVDEEFRVYDKNSIALTLVSDALGVNNGTSTRSGRTRRDSRSVHNEEDDNCDDFDLDDDENDEIDGGDILLACE